MNENEYLTKCETKHMLAVTTLSPAETNASLSYLDTFTYFGPFDDHTACETALAALQAMGLYTDVTYFTTCEIHMPV